MLRNHPQFAFHKGGKERITIPLPDGISIEYGAWLALAQNFKTVETYHFTSMNSDETTTHLSFGISPEVSNKFEVGDVEAQVSYKDSNGDMHYFEPVYGLCLRAYENTSATQ